MPARKPKYVFATATTLVMRPGRYHLRAGQTCLQSYYARALGQRGQRQNLAGAIGRGQFVRWESAQDMQVLVAAGSLHDSPRLLGLQDGANENKLRPWESSHHIQQTM